MKTHPLRERYQAFHYDDYTYSIEENTMALTFFYRLEERGGGISFCHKVNYTYYGSVFETKDAKMIETFVFHIGLMETINYYKLACPKDLFVHCGQLTDEQKEWWSKLFFHGLGEFIYLNGMGDTMREENFVTFHGEGKIHQTITEETKGVMVREGALIPIGGGKDSVVTLELLKADQDKNLPFLMSAPVAAYDCMKVAGYTNYLEAKRIFDKQMIQMNNDGYMNGHVPFSAILAYIALFGAFMTGQRYIPLSNERSANEPSVIGTTFNHQYSKSYEFELDFDTYIKQYVVTSIDYFSLLRPLYEIQIAQLFANYTAYHPVFRSCNRGKSTNSWCGVCAKCLFVYIILSPFMEQQALTDYFGKNLFEDGNLIELMDELAGLRETKPFECVGTIWEVRYALNHAVEKQETELPVLLQHYVDIHGPELPRHPQDYESGDLVPAHFLEVLHKEMERYDIQRTFN